MKILIRLASFCLPALMLASTAVQATALVRVTPQGVAVADQTVLDPVPISADGFRLTYHGGGNDEILDPMILIFATAQGASAPLLTASGASNPGTLGVNITLGGTNVYGGTWDTVTGAAGTFDSSDSGSVYDDIGFDTQGNSSQNYSNWNGTSGLTSWDLWVYTLEFTPDLEHGYWLEFDTSGLAESSFVVGYGCTDVLSSGLCDAQSSTPFTFAGYVTGVPEPGMLALLSIGLIGVAGVRRFKA